MSRAASAHGAVGRGAPDLRARRHRVQERAGRTSAFRPRSAAAPNGGWQLSVTGRDAVVRGPEPGEPPFAIDTIEARRAGRGRRARARAAASSSGRRSTSRSNGTYGGAADPKALSVKGQARKTAARTALRLWPNAVVPKVRDYLVANLRGGSADLIDVAVALLGRRSGRMRSATGRSRIGGEGELSRSAAQSSRSPTACRRCRPLRLRACHRDQGQGAGAERTRSNARRPRARRARGHLRRLRRLVEGAPAAIALRLDGGADALGALLNSPLLQGVSGVDLDPAGIKGRADVARRAEPAAQEGPRMDDLPLRISGRSATSTIDKAFGKERLDGANLDRSLRERRRRDERRGPALGRSGRDRGAPAQGGTPARPSSASSLDDAARARKGISFGRSSPGRSRSRSRCRSARTPRPAPRSRSTLRARSSTISSRAGSSRRGGPGSSPSSCAEGSTELREFVARQRHGADARRVTLSAEGQLEKADSQLVQAFARRRHAGAARARRRSLQGRGARTGRGCPAFHPQPDLAAARARKRKETKESRDVDLDVSTNILTGFNDEALTAATSRRPSGTRR